jgi:hypothetical protein
MKTLFTILLSFCFLFLSGGCNDDSEITSTNTTTYKFERSMKGWELYSWKVDGQWKYSILIGTNRNKTYQEIISGNLLVTGEKELKNLMAQIPEGEYVFWFKGDQSAASIASGFSNFKLPPAEVVDDIKQFCVTAKLIFYVAE